MPDQKNLPQEYAALRDRFRVVTDLGLRLASELDLNALLAQILSETRRLSNSEAGSLYVVEGKRLAFKLAQNDSQPEAVKTLKEFRLPIDKSTLAGTAALSKKTLNIEDVQQHSSYDRETADKLGYQVQTMLVVPMVDHRKRVTGVLQLMNAQTEAGESVAYDHETAYLVEVLASHASTAIEVAKLYEQIRLLLKAMVIYTVDAIDARDPATAGHSGRVAKYAVKLAEFHGGFSKLELREIEYAGLFHDVGKIGVPEHILTKPSKLLSERQAVIVERVESAKRASEVEILRSGLAAAAADKAIIQKFDELDEAWRDIQKLACPTPLTDSDCERLEQLAGYEFVDSSGRRQRLLAEQDVEALNIKRGTLTSAEREIMESHLTMSVKILRKFPFTDELARVPEYVAQHHEKWDGTGYPHGLKGEEISLAGRILALADVLDALTAQDRPYKRPILVERSLEILTAEAKRGMWDPRLVELLKAAIQTSSLKMPKDPSTDRLRTLDL